MHDLSAIRTVVFAGGGNRCFWQAGFYRTLADEQGLAPETLVAVSAGAAIATALAAGRIEQTLSLTCEAMERNPRNQYWDQLLDPRRRVFPHELIYRDLIHRVLADDAWEELRNGPEVSVALARPPRWLGAHAGTLAGLLAYQGEKWFSQPVHPKAGRRLGFRREFVSHRQCRSPADLADLIIASSCTPPFTRLARWQGQPALDGGLVDNVPCDGIPEDDGQTLVLLSRPYPHLPEIPGRIYAQPSTRPPVGSWDYTSPRSVREAFQLGQADAAGFQS